MDDDSLPAKRVAALPHRRSTATHRASRFKQSDVKRALKAARDGGLDVGRVEIDAEGKIVLVANAQAIESTSPLDKWKKERARPS